MTRDKMTRTQEARWSWWERLDGGVDGAIKHAREMACDENGMAVEEAAATTDKERRAMATRAVEQLRVLEAKIGLAREQIERDLDLVWGARPNGRERAVLAGYEEAKQSGAVAAGDYARQHGLR